MENIVYSRLSSGDDWDETLCYNIDDVIETFTHKLSLGYTVKLNENARRLLNDDMFNADFKI